MRVGASALLAVADPERVRELREEAGQWAFDEVRLTVEAERWMAYSEKHFGYDHPDGEEIVALCGACWNFGVLQALARGSLSRELLIEACRAPDGDDDADEKGAIARVVDNLLQIGLLHLGLDDDDETRGLVLSPSAWLIRAVSPLLVAARIESESENAAGSPLEALDWATLLQMAARAVPMVGWPGTGTVRLVCELGEEHFPDKAVVTVRVEDGAIVDAVVGELADPPAAEVIGSEDGWYRALLDLHPTSLEYRGVEGGRALVEACGASLFRHGRRSSQAGT